MADKLLHGECPNCGADIPASEMLKPCAECGARSPAIERAKATEHTPTPWYGKATAGDHHHAIMDEGGKVHTIALVYTDANDAAFIVRAVNNYDALLAALIRLRDCPNVQMDETDAETDAARKQANEAIREAVHG